MNQSQRYSGALALIKSQTNYTEDEAIEKLKQWDGNYMNVIKEYLNPDFHKKKSATQKKSTNELMMGEIRNFMDTANSEFLKRKEIEKLKQEKMKEIYEAFLKKKEEFPDCRYNPPHVLSCDSSCQNTMCPGELQEDKTYKKEDIKQVINI